MVWWKGPLMGGDIEGLTKGAFGEQDLACRFGLSLFGVV